MKLTHDILIDELNFTSIEKGDIVEYRRKMGKARIVKIFYKSGEFYAVVANAVCILKTKEEVEILLKIVYKLAYG